MQLSLRRPVLEVTGNKWNQLTTDQVQHNIMNNIMFSRECFPIYGTK